jgi:acyl-CoA thioesterase-1
MRSGWRVWVAIATTIACGGSAKDGAGGDSVRAAAMRDSVRVDSADAASSRRPSADGRRTVLFIGTSLTAGLGLDPEDAYPRLVQRLADSAGLDYEFVNAGLSGETSAGALRRVDWLLRGDADVIVVETGANDGLRGLDVDSTAANIRAVVRKVKTARPSAVILLAQMEAPPNLGERYTGAFRRMFQTVARDEGVILLPFLLEGVAGVPRLNQPDGIHPNEDGEEIVAANVWRALRPVLESLDQRQPTS